ncbi:MAG: group II intron maturase-specific domain-containing protein, partial [Thiomonas sp.]
VSCSAYMVLSNFTCHASNTKFQTGSRELGDLAAMFNPILRGWQQYYGRFHGSAMSAIWKHMNDYLVRWMMRKYKTLARHKTRARHALGQLARRFPTAFVHWKLGCLPAVG